MDRKLEGKVAVVTGGSAGIGLGIAQEFVAEGATVFITGRRQEELDKAVKSMGSAAIGVCGDVAKLSDLDHLYNVVQQRASHIDILVANAGGASFQALPAITEAEFDRMFGVNVKGTLFTVQKALPLFRDGGSIILITSTATTRAVAGFSIYGATKAAIRNFARHWCLDLKDRHIRVNAISPGPTATPGLLGLTVNEEEQRKFMQHLAALPAGRIAEPREIGRAAVFLASPESSYVTGTELFVDGGMAQI
jgi:NAD(P)-dependent dehydrogenase (short-subunit alcohol dehydrogenase family)